MKTTTCLTCGRTVTRDQTERKEVQMKVRMGVTTLNDGTFESLNDHVKRTTAKRIKEGKEAERQAATLIAFIAVAEDFNH